MEWASIGGGVGFGVEGVSGWVGVIFFLVGCGRLIGVLIEGLDLGLGQGGLREEWA